MQRELEPYVEKNLSDNNFAYRKRVSVHDCFRKINKVVEAGNTWVVKIDIVKFFDNIDRNKLLKKTEDMLDKDTTKVIESIIEAPVIINGKEVHLDRGLMQGFNISPLLSNIYLNSFDQYWDKKKDYGIMLRYSDDILIFASGRKKTKKNLQIAKKQLRDLGLSCTTEGPINLRQDKVKFLSFKHYITLDNRFVQLPTDKKIQFLNQKWDEDVSKDYGKFKRKYSYYFFNTSREQPRSRNY